MMYAGSSMAAACTIAGGDSRNRQGWPDSKATLEDALCEMRDALEYAYDRWQPHEVGGLKGSLPAMDAAM